MFSQGQFLIDPNAPPEEIIRKRAALDKVMRAYGRASNIGEGVGDLAMGIGQGIQNWRVGKAERAQTEGANSAFDSLFGAGQPAAPTMEAGGFPSAPETGASSPVSMPKGETADYIRQGLIQRGLPEHVADAFVVNFQDESGLNPGVNEAAPLVPGSRGGFGLYQLTGPRRVAYEKFAQERGVPLDNTDAQLDFLMLEGQGAEKSAFDKILSAPDTATAAQAIVSDFLRPAQVHRDSRMARYANLASRSPALAQSPTVDPVAYNAQVVRQSPDLSGDPPLQGQPTMQSMAGRMPAPQGQPMPQGRDQLAAALMQQQAAPPAQQAIEQAAPQEVDPRAQFNSPQLNAADPTKGILKVLMERGGQQGQPRPPVARVQQAMQGQNGTSLDLNKAIELMNNPFLDKGKKAVLGAMIERQMAAQDPSNQLDMEYKRAQLEQLRNPRVEPTAEMRNLEWRAQQAGLQPGMPEYAQFMASGGGKPLVEINNGGSSKYNDEIDKNFAQQYIDIQNGAQAAQSKIATLQGLQGALEQSSFTGMGAETLLGVKQAARSLGLDIGDNLGPEETARALGNQLALQMRSPSNGAGMPGAMSDKDREFLVASVPGLGKTPDGNRRLIDFMTRVEQRNIQVAQMAQDYQERNGQLNNGFYKELSAWSAQNPLFPEADQPQQDALPDGVSEEDIQFTMEKHGLTREQVLERLNAN